jgi:hypothetical protein
MTESECRAICQRSWPGRGDCLVTNTGECQVGLRWDPLPIEPPVALASLYGSGPTFEAALTQARANGYAVIGWTP